ncbi:MAG: tetratricopeptide repeat protein [Anaerolineales bacterium]|nr:MAG: tetratricopeptide repeat protein [Anaerolineales bacterium]
MRLTGEKLRLSRGRRRSNPWRILALLSLLVGAILLMRAQQQGEVRPLFQATPTATRTGSSFAEEAEVHFAAGDLPAAIRAYQAGIQADPTQAELWAMLARAQTYNSFLLTTQEERRQSLGEARRNVDQAVAINPDSAIAHAVRAFTYDWSASAEVKDSITVGDQVRVSGTIGEGGVITANLIELEGLDLATDEGSETGEGAALIFSGQVDAIEDESWVVGGRTLALTPLTLIRDRNRREIFLAEAQNAATRALQLETNYSLANAYRAEILVDQGNVAQAEDLSEQALGDALNRRMETAFLMDIHRVRATVFESQGFYNSAIEEYLEAAKINPNLTILYLKIGANYRALSQFDQALEYFDKAARINSQLGIQDPNPYLAIGNTYARDGEFFVASINMQRALSISPSTPEIYARLATVFYQARNYEGSIPMFKCALRGCSAQETGDVFCELGLAPNCEPETESAAAIGVVVAGMPLSSETVEYYYTYGSALTFYAGSEVYPTACDDAEDVFVELMAKYGGEALIAAIVDEGRLICNQVLLPTEPSLTPEETTPTPNS